MKRNNDKLETTSALNLMAYMARQFNIELYFFTSKDVHMEDKTVDAVLIDGNKQTPKTIPLPKIVYNHFECLTDEPRREMKSFLQRECFFVNSGVWLEKQKMYNLLLKDGKFKNFLIESHPVKDFEDLLLLLEKYNNDVVVKPDGGMQGNGVTRIIHNDDGYLITHPKMTVLLKTDEEFLTFYNEYFTQRKQILQPYIISRTKYGTPFDIRIHARRGAGGKFQLFPYPRIGRDPESILSNISAGGHTMPIWKFLRQEYGDDCKMIHSLLIDFGSKFSNYIQSLFDKRISSMGIDVSIQRRDNSYELKIFEVQSDLPGYSAIETVAAFVNLEYIQYLCKKLAEGVPLKELAKL